MSLKAFEQAWIELLLNPEQQLWHQLSADERASLASLSPEQLDTWRQEARSRRCAALATVLPRRIRQLLGEALSEQVIQELCDSPGLPPLYPRRELVSYLLQQLLARFGREARMPPHLRDLVSYELAVARLVFFTLPTPGEEALKGPRLAAWARLIRLGEQFPAVLESLNQGYGVTDLPESPTRRFLLTRDLRGLGLEALPPPVLACLECCDGTRPWSELVAELQAQQSERLDDTELESWHEHFLRRGVLVSPHR